MQDLILEIHRQNRNTRHDQQDHHSQPDVQQEHDRKHADHIEQRPEHIHQPPCNDGGDPQCIAHDARMDIAYRRRIVIGKGQGLQVLKLGPLQIPSQIHLNDDRRMD